MIRLELLIEAKNYLKVIIDAMIFKNFNQLKNMIDDTTRKNINHFLAFY